MGRLATVLATLPVLLLASPAARAQGESRILDRIAAVIVTPTRPEDPGVITLTRLEFEARVYFIWRLQGHTTAATAPLDTETRRAVLTYVLGQRLIYDQAEMQDVSKVSASKVEDRLNTFASYLGGPGALTAFLARQGMRLEELQRILERDLRVQQHLDESPTFEAKPSPAEVDAYARAHAVELVGIVDPNDQLDTAISGATAEKRLRLEQAQLRQLFAHAKVRIVDRDLAGADAPFQPGSTSPGAAASSPESESAP